MTYQALARKWRPRRFSELVGQAHAVRALSHALTQDKLHQALLFAGTRGVGKTTLARIIAKCLNCEHGVTAEPCTDNPCSACAEIDEGRFVDLIEVDAASRTGVDDTRDLMDNVQYAPTIGRRKVYLIDEVHMLSKHAFNALLKTLEEPPPHVQFLLATTDPQKIPITILSRCLQFPLKRLPVQEIGDQLSMILRAEGVESEPEALTAIARAADGSMRDGLSLLDQAVAFGGGRVDAAEVHAMLGTVAAASVQSILQALASGDGNALMTALSELDQQGPDYAAVHDALAEALHRIAVLQLVPDAAGDEASPFNSLSGQLNAADVQLYYDIALAGRRDLDWAPDPRTGLEMTCLRMLAFRPADGDASASAGAPGRPKAQPATGTAKAPAPPTAAQAAPSSTPVQPPLQSSPSPSQQPQASAVGMDGPATVAGDAATTWDALVARLGLKGMTAELARNCVCQALDGRQVKLELPKQLEHLNTDRARRQLETALQREHSADARLQLTLGQGSGDSPAQLASARDSARRDAATESISADPNVQALQQRLGAQLKPDSIEPHDD